MRASSDRLANALATVLTAGASVIAAALAADEVALVGAPATSATTRAASFLMI